MTDKPKTPWKNGYYYGDKCTAFIKKVDGQSCELYNIICLDFPDIEPIASGGTWTFGDFGPADEEVQKASGGIKNYNLDLKTWQYENSFGILSEDGKTIYSHGMMGTVETMKWQSDEDLKKLAEEREPYEAPSCPYKIQPENQGKLVWLSGPPGSGKTTTAQLMSREAGYAYVEADCTMCFLNPFVPPNVDNPAHAAMLQKPLKGIPRDVASQMKIALNEFEKIGQPGYELDMEKIKPFYRNMAKDIDTQKKRIGGNFLIAQAIHSEKMRDYVRTILPDCIFIILTPNDEVQLKRIIARHGEGNTELVDTLTGYYKLYELPGKNEPNTFNVDITDGLTPKDVMNKVLEILENL